LFLLLKSLRDVGAGKPSVNSANLETMEDPKPGDLSMSRVNFREI